MKNVATLPALKARERNSAGGIIGARARSCQARKPAASAAPAISAPSTSGLSQPALLPRTSPQTRPSAAPMTSARPRQVDRPVAAEALLHPGEHERQRDQPDRDVEPEDPLPADALDDGAADERAERHGHAGDRAEDADRGAALRGRERRAEQREPERDQQRRARALDGAGGDQPADVGRERAGRGRGGEEAETDPVEPPPAEPVAERGAGHEQHGEAEVVAVDGPLELLERRAEIGLDGAERARHHEGVERGHQRADGGEGDDPARAGSLHRGLLVRFAHAQGLIRRARRIHRSDSSGRADARPGHSPSVSPSIWRARSVWSCATRTS